MRDNEGPMSRIRRRKGMRRWLRGEDEDMSKI